MKCPRCKGELIETERYTLFGKRYGYYCEKCEMDWDGLLTIGIRR